MTGEGGGGAITNNSNKTLVTNQMNINTVNSETLCSQGATQRDSSFSSMVFGSSAAATTTAAASQFNKLSSNNMSILNSNTSTSKQSLLFQNPTQPHNQNQQTLNTEISQSGQNFFNSNPVINGQLPVFLPIKANLTPV